MTYPEYEACMNIAIEHGNTSYINTAGDLIVEEDLIDLDGEYTTEYHVIPDLYALRMVLGY